MDRISFNHRYVNIIFIFFSKNFRNICSAQYSGNIHFQNVCLQQTRVLFSLTRTIQTPYPHGLKLPEKPYFKPFLKRSPPIYSPLPTPSPTSPFTLSPKSPPYLPSLIPPFNRNFFLIYILFIGYLFCIFFNFSVDKSPKWLYTTLINSQFFLHRTHMNNLYIFALNEHHRVIPTQSFQVTEHPTCYSFPKNPNKRIKKSDIGHINPEDLTLILTENNLSLATDLFIKHFTNQIAAIEHCLTAAKNNLKEIMNNNV